MTPATSFVSKPVQLRDAVVLVHDVVAGAQVGEALQRAARRSASRAAAACGRPACRAAARARARARRSRGAPARPRTAGRSGGSPGSSRPRLHAAQQRLLPQRLAAVRERDDDVELLAQQAAQLVLGLGEPACRERRPLRVERERLALRQRRQLGRAVELDAA